MDVRDLETVLAITRAGTVPAAARVLGVAHTTLYRRLDALEEELGVRLFERGTVGWRVTSAGAELAREAAEVEARLGAVVERVRGRDGRLEGEVRLATGDTITMLLAPALRRFIDRYPAIRVRVTAGATPARLSAGEADLLVWVTADPEPDAIGRRVMVVRYAVFGTADRAAMPEADRPWVALEPSVDPGQQARWEREHLPWGRVNLRTTSRALHVDAVRAGLGVGVLPLPVANNTDLVRLSPDLPELERPLWLLVRRDALHVARVAALHEFLLAEAAAIDT